MVHLRRILIVILVLLPVGLAGLVPLAPEATAYMQAAQGAEQAKKSGDRASEISNLSVLTAYQPWRSDLWEREGNLQMAVGNPQSAVAAYQNAAQNGSLSAQSLFDEGKAWYSLGNLDSAKGAYRAASEAGSQEIHFYLTVAAAQEEIDDSIGTLATLLHAYALAPQDKGLNYALGVQFTATQPQNALKFLNNVVNEAAYGTFAQDLISTIQNTESLGETAGHYIYLGQELSQVGEWQAAASAFDKATQLDSQNGIAWALLGEAVQHVGGDGYEQLAKSLQLSPHSDIVNGLMAIYYRRHQKYDTAITYLYKAVENNPNEATWQIEIGNTLALEGNLSDALVHLQVATLSESENWITWESLASFCITYNYEVATVGIDAARRALLLVPGNAVLLDIMGSAYMDSGDEENAERFYLQALQAAPNQAEIQYHLGQLYLQEQRKDLAFTYLRDAAMNATDSRIRDNANALLAQNGGN